MVHKTGYIHLVLQTLNSSLYPMKNIFQEKKITVNFCNSLIKFKMCNLRILYFIKKRGKFNE